MSNCSPLISFCVVFVLVWFITWKIACFGTRLSFHPEDYQIFLCINEISHFQLEAVLSEDLKASLYKSDQWFSNGGSFILGISGMSGVITTEVHEKSQICCFWRRHSEGNKEKLGGSVERMCLSLKKRFSKHYLPLLHPIIFYSVLVANSFLQCWLQFSDTSLEK